MMRRQVAMVLALLLVTGSVVGCDREEAETEAEPVEQGVEQEVQEESEARRSSRSAPHFENWNVRAMDLPRPARPHQNVITSAQPSAAQLEALSEYGIARVINLRDENEPGFEDLQDAAEAAGLEYFHLPIARPDDLNRRNVTRFSRLIDEIESPVLVFCEDSDRTGAMIALRFHWHTQQSPIEAIRRGKVAGLAQSEDAVRDLVYGDGSEEEEENDE